MRKKCANILVQRNYNSPRTQHRALVTHPNCLYADTPLQSVRRNRPSCQLPGPDASLGAACPKTRRYRTW